MTKRDAKPRSIFSNLQHFGGYTGCAGVACPLPTFSGSIRPWCEAMVIVLQYITDDWTIKQCVCKLMLLVKSMTGEEIAQQIILSTGLGISSDLVIAAMRDQASVNSVAMVLR